mmetsp:Transcript_25407/g.19144  ORF Transcript_25407/g.19144 Transcript_25407/m.19144 type:complete len:170 (+) Transcript_25407:314-823(+)
MSKLAELDITEKLFETGGEMASITSSTLRLEKDYSSFGKKVGEILYKGATPYNIPKFFKEVLADLGGQCDSVEIKEVLDVVTTLYNEKVKQEKGAKTAGKKAKATKPGLAQGKVQDNANRQMISAAIGGEDEDYGEEAGYGEEDYYGEEADYGAGKGRKKVKEEQYDFM